MTHEFVRKGMASFLLSEAPSHIHNRLIKAHNQILMRVKSQKALTTALSSLDQV